MINPKEAIKEYFSSIDSPVTLSELAKLLGYTPSKFNEWLKKPSEKIDLKYLLSIYCVTGVHPSAYGITNDLLMGNQRLDVFDSLDTRFKKLAEGQSFFISFNQFKEKSAPENYSERYFSELKSRIKETKHSIYVYDYFVNNQLLFSDRDKEKYFKGYEKYFNQITERAKEEPQLKYNRLIGVPLNINDLMDFEDIGIEKAFKKCFLLFSEEFFDHLIDSFQSFGERFSLYMSEFPSRLFSVMILDKSYLASEYYRIKEAKNQKFIMVPDIIFIDFARPNSDHGILLQTYLSEFSNIKKTKISPRRIYGWVSQILPHIENGKAKYKESLIDANIEKYELYEKLQIKLLERKRKLQKLIS